MVFQVVETLIVKHNPTITTISAGESIAVIDVDLADGSCQVEWNGYVVCQSTLTEVQRAKDLGFIL